MPLPKLTRVAALCALVALAVLTCVAGQSTPDCTDAQACFPWSSSGPSCRRSARFNLRFLVDLADENSWRQTPTVMNHEAVYGFCPRVDELQSFTLNSAPFLTSAYASTNAAGNITYQLTRTLSTAYLSAFGFGNSNNTLYPIKGNSTGSVVIAQNGSTVCSSFRSVALVTTLVLNVGFNRGLFNYDGSSEGGMRTVPNPNYDPTRCGSQNTSSGSRAAPSVAPAMPAAVAHAGSDDDAATIAWAAAAGASSSSSSSAEINYCDPQIEVYVEPTIVQPLKTGFVPTCGVDGRGEDYCMFDSGSEVICVGDTGQKNCARCYTDARAIANQASLQIWTSYYGTDSKGATLRSGGTNPINFRKYAKPNLLSDIGSKLRSLWRGNVSDAGLPVWPF